MYQCQLCQKVVPANTKAHRVVVETRPRTYWRPVPYTHPLRFEVEGIGWEIVREVLACPDCAAQSNQRT